MPKKGLKNIMDRKDNEYKSVKKRKLKKDKLSRHDNSEDLIVPISI